MEEKTQRRPIPQQGESDGGLACDARKSALNSSSNGRWQSRGAALRLQSRARAGLAGKKQACRPARQRGVADGLAEKPRAVLGWGTGFRIQLLNKSQRSTSVRASIPAERQRIPIRVVLTFDFLSMIAIAPSSKKRRRTRSDNHHDHTLSSWWSW
jgi:hypothetical protein